MIKVSVLYANPDDPAAFEDYYATTHLPIAATLPDLRRTELSRVVGGPGGEPSRYYRTADLYFDSPEAVQAAFASPEGQAVVADLPNFATGGVEVVICDVHAG